ncbi:MAG: hypothetical protein R3B59_10590 [Dehalococcoidia bacterium]
MLDFLNENQGAISGLSSLAAFLTTLALVAVTWRYTAYTKQIAQGSSEPRLSAWLFAPAANLVFLRLGNLGAGPALDIEFTLRFDALERPVVLRWPALAPGEFEDLKMPSSREGVEAALSLDEVRELGGVDVSTSSSSVDRRRHTSHDRIELNDVLESAMTAQMLVTENHPNRIAVSLRDEIRKAREALQTISRTMPREHHVDSQFPPRWN